MRGMREAMPTVKLLVLLAGMLVCTFPFGAAKGVAFLAPANPQRLHPAHQTQPSRCASVVVTSLRKDGSEDEFRESFLGGLFRDVLPSQEEIRKAQVERMRRRDGLRGNFRKAQKPEEAEKEQEKIVSRYVPPEESPSGQKRPSIEAEQRIQFDAMREGNAFNQNVILSKTLKRGG